MGHTNSALEQSTRGLLQSHEHVVPVAKPKQGEAR